MESKSTNPPLIVIVGQTASGKTAAAIEIAKKVNGEIICADSRTIYKFMDIGTAKPSQEEQQGIPHHLINVIEPDETFSVAKFQELAYKCISEIHSRGHFPIMVGGTGLYIDSVLYDFQFSNEANSEYRNELEQMSDVELTTIMNTKGINTANLNTKNRRHVIRAIERGGEVQKQQVLRSNTLVLGIKPEREVLRARISTRVDEMFSDGFIDEAKTLAQKYGWDSESMSGIGYRVAREFIEGRATEQEAKDAFKSRDNSLAKRQRTWFKRNSNIEWFPDAVELIATATSFVTNSNKLI